MSFSASVNAASTGTTVAAGLNLTTWLEGPIFLHNEGIRATKISIIRGLEFLFRSTEDVLPDQIRSIWLEFRGRAIAPLLQAAVVLCLIMSVMLLVEAVYMSAVSLTVKLLRRKPQKRYKWEPIKEDVEIGSRTYPMVLVQIPMYNEKEVYKLSIGAACGLTWPPEQIIIQVLDDSTDQTVKSADYSQEARKQAQAIFDQRYLSVDGRIDAFIQEKIAEAKESRSAEVAEEMTILRKAAADEKERAEKLALEAATWKAAAENSGRAEQTARQELEEAKAKFQGEMASLTAKIESAEEEKEAALDRLQASFQEQVRELVTNVVRRTKAKYEKS